MKNQPELFALYQRLTDKTTYTPKPDAADIYGYWQSKVVVYQRWHAE